MNRRAVLQRLPAPKYNKPRRPERRPGGHDGDQNDAASEDASLEDETPDGGEEVQHVEDGDSEEDIWCEKVVNGAVVRVRRVLRPKSRPLTEEQRWIVMMYK